VWPDDAVTVWTIGHSTRPYEAFLGLLRGREIELLADVRQFCGRATPNDDVTMVVVRYDG